MTSAETLAAQHRKENRQGNASNLWDGLLREIRQNVARRHFNEGRSLTPGELPSIRTSERRARRC